MMLQPASPPVLSAPSVHAADSSSAISSRANSSSGQALPPAPLRVPDNVGFLEAACVAAAVIYTAYLVLMRRRWLALRLRQQRFSSHSAKR